MYRNSEHYEDPTAGKAVDRVTRPARMPQKDIRPVIKALKAVADLAGFEISGRIILRDKKTGREYY